MELNTDQKLSAEFPMFTQHYNPDIGQITDCVHDPKFGCNSCIARLMCRMETPMPKINCELIFCRHNSNGECIAEEITVNSDGFCLGYEEKLNPLENPNSERDIKEN